MRSLAARLVAGWRCDLVFNIAEGVAGFGRESQVPALLEAYGIPYTFSDPLVCALTLHKGMAKHVARGCGVPTPSFVLVGDARGGGGRRVAVAAVREARRGGQQQGRHGQVARDVAGGARRGLHGAARALSPARDRRGVLERPRVHGRHLGHGRRRRGRLRRSRSCCSRAPMPARTRTATRPSGRRSSTTGCSQPGRCATEVEAVALATWRCLGCRDAGRVDVRLDGGGRAADARGEPARGADARLLRPADHGRDVRHELTQR